MRSKQDIIYKDSFNLYRNFKHNVIYLYSGNERNLEINSYNEFLVDGTHYEEHSFPEGIIDTLLDKNDIFDIYSRYIYLDEAFESYINSYFCLFYDNFNYKLESLYYYLSLNNYLQNNSDSVVSYTNKIPFYEKGQNLTEYVKLHISQLLSDTNKEDKKVKEIKLKEINSLINSLNLDNYIKKFLFNDIFLFSNYLSTINTNSNNNN